MSQSNQRAPGISFNFKGKVTTRLKDLIQFTAGEFLKRQRTLDAHSSPCAKLRNFPLTAKTVLFDEPHSTKILKQNCNYANQS